ncbi:galactofuranosyltransferase [Lactobacillus reuteri]|uniref:galactofuranosyltransferase n=1 Tax=Limosilactobacillus reuteri TaxID=1598 RepID=UPI00146BF3D3|nr:galactofuranosyltransferase [Limosilactobacillus reuteri]NMV49225.1 galactofuranosyltransferase [Limosilactobacillus reuteri]NMV50758.1 galactofuranosyltransferase [Limosilactobacillus reuteri]NMV59829.1 galactofuranosyltransferase [Limosilactobacillus reuteri]NMV61663.1 galactofuranosyltransferase [Limosilactobacillus reuteri]NMV63406.1 galactofuranosyltransferase [Limosilactobacillus reuteri]
MQIYYLRETSKEGRDAGSKARIDVENIFNKLKIKPISPFLSKKNRLYAYLFFLWQLKKTNKSDIIVVQYPLPRGYNSLLKYVAKHRKIVAIIHDLTTLRFNKDFKDDKKQLKNLLYIIAHNKRMKDYLISKGITAPIISLELFDYLVNKEQKVNDHSNDSELICFAGNLSKSNFIYKLPESLIKLGINLYGIGFDSRRESANELNYIGSFNSEDIVSEIKGRYGLVWDGDSSKYCAGNMGNYLKYNNPHKASMYIAARMPLIVWTKSALAEFVKEQEIGLVVNSLDEIPYKTKKINAEEYNHMVSNVNKVRDKILNGLYLQNALKQIFEKE